MPVPNSPHLYRRVISAEPPPENEEDFESPMTKSSAPKFTSRFDGRKYTSGVEAFLNEDKAGGNYTSNIRKELLSNCAFMILQVFDFEILGK